MREARLTHLHSVRRKSTNASSCSLPLVNLTLSTASYNGVLYVQYIKSKSWKTNRPFDIIIVAKVVSLLLLLRVVQHHYRSVKVDDLSRGQQVEVGAAVTTTVAISAPRLS